MKLLKTNRGIVLSIYVKPDSREFKIEVEDDELVVNCKESPAKGKVNNELVKEFSRLFRRKVEIVFGFTSKQKKILVTDSSLDEVADVISRFRLRE